MKPHNAKSDPRLGRVLAVGLSCLAAAGFAPATRAQDAPPSEYQLKAAFLYNFAKFVEWPPSSFPASDTPITIGVFGENPFGSDLERMLKNKTVEGRALVVRAIPNLAELKACHCHIVFLPVGARRSFSQIIESLRSANVLTVGEMDRFTEGGGMINLVMEGKKVRFDINAEAARRAGLKISPRLLKLARNHGTGD